MTLATPISAERTRDSLGVLRSGAWLTAARARAYGWILLVISLAVIVGWIVLAPTGMDPAGKPIGTDFTSFWSASRLALRGSPAGAYDIAAHHAQENAIFGRDTGYAAFFYPPVFLLICLPLGLLPYLAALAAWLAATGAAYWRTVKAWLGDGFGAVPILAFPAVLVNAGHGQNGFLSAALFGTGALWLERRPILAGVFLGALAYKPHLGLMLPVALIVAGRWKTFAAAAVTVIVAALVSVALFGVATWQAFATDSALARATLEQGLVGDGKMQSLFAAVRLWGGPLWLAYGAQAALAAAVVGALIWLQRRAPNSGAEGPAMIVAALIASPFLLDYDLVILAVPLAWMLREGARTRFLDWEKTVLATAFILPAVSRMLAMEVRLPLAPLVMGALLWLIVKRGVSATVAAAPIGVLAAA